MTVLPRVVVLGVGNTLMQDDGVGVWAARALAGDDRLPSNVRVVEGGIAGLRLLPDILAASCLIIVDAMNGKAPPGSIYRLDADRLPDSRGPLMSAHDVGVVELLSVANFMGKRPPTKIVGVQPLQMREVGLDLTPPLQAALPRVVDAVIEMIANQRIEAARKRDSMEESVNEQGANHA